MKIKNLKIKLKYSVVSGILVFGMIILLFISQFNYRFNSIISIISQILIIIALLCFYLIFIWGFKIVGDKTKNKLLIYSTIAFIVIPIIFSLRLFLKPYLPEDIYNIIDIVRSFIIAIVGVLFGIGLLKLKKQFGTDAIVAGNLVIFFGVCSLNDSLSKLFMFGFIPTFIYLKKVLYKAEKKYE